METPRRQERRPTTAAQGSLAAASSDRRIEGVAAALDGQDGPQRLLEGERQAALGEALLAEPAFVGLRPGLALPDEPLTQQQLAKPVAGAHEVGPRVLAGAHEVAGALLGGARHAHRGELAEAQQLGQAQSVAAVGLDALAGRLGDLRGRRHQARDLRRRAGARQAEAGGARLVGDGERRALSSNQGTSSAVRGGAAQLRTSPVLPSRTPAATDRACTSRPMNVSSLMRRLPVTAALPPPSVAATRVNLRGGAPRRYIRSKFAARG